MVQAALRSGAAHRRSVFEVFARRLPEGRRYAVLAGTGRLLDAIERFRFGDE
ncbi:MAG: nicotinate phosphoribosyltransferase, partial [Actinomycetota bacterium]|nr:nicotinate phosphoribosyltransferase [Actinomycetota bacterium]